MKIKDEKILAFCDAHPNFDVERCLLAFIDMYQLCEQTDTTNAMTDMVKSMMTKMNEVMIEGLADVKEYSKVGTDRISQEISQIGSSTVERTVNSVRQHIQDSSRDLKDCISKENQLALATLKTELSSQSQGVSVHLLTVAERLNQLADVKMVTMAKDMENLANNLNQNRSFDDVQMENMLLKLQDGLIPTLKTEFVDMIKPESLRSLESNILELKTTWTAFTDRLNRSGGKGAITESVTKVFLENQFPTFDFVKIASKDQKGKMDINIHRPNRSVILLDTKDYKNTVPREEVRKFENDILLGKMHGILFSPHASIYGKKNFTIGEIGGKLGIYICNTGQDVTSFEMALRFIDYFDDIVQRGTESGQYISQEKMSQIQFLLNEAAARSERMRQNLKQCLNEVESLETATMKNISIMLGLSSEVEKEILSCSKCGKVCANKGSLTNHVKSCNTKSSS